MPPKGHFAAALGMEGSIPTGSLLSAIDTGKSVGKKAASGQSLTSEEKWEVFDAGMKLLLNPPSFFSYHVRLAYVPIERLEVSLRYAGPALRLATRYQLLDRATAPFDMSAGLGISCFTYEIPFADYIPVLKLDDFTRWQLDVPLLIGVQNRWFRAWTGPRFVATFFDTNMHLDLVAEEPVLASMSGKAYYVGGQGGLGFGYRFVFVAFELTITRILGSARFDAPAITDAPARTLDLSGFVIYPSLGLMGEF
ncbi:MAG: hypothetical protein JXP73_18450 [Deltaproteobacteria bacterium]|nr:hypothetical protein [Deltaproteobacteria bacterium]